MAFEAGRIEGDDGRVLFDTATRPRGYWARLRGLLGRAPLVEDQAWWFDRCSAVHTFGMRVPIDIVHLDRTGRVLRIRPAVAPASMSLARRGRSVIETGAGATARAGISKGEILRFLGDPQ